MSKADRFEALRLNRAGRVLTISLARAAARNAVNQQMHRELSEAFLEAQNDSLSDIVVLTGEGDAFSAGGDLAYMNHMLATPGAFEESASGARRLIFALLDLSKPVVARINGDAIGLGATLALLADITIAVDCARIGDPHVRVGLAAGDGGAFLWPALIGFARAKEALLTGSLISASRAAEFGLINYAVPTDELDSKVGEIISNLEAGSPAAVRYTKMCLNIGLKQLATAVMDASLGYGIVTALSSDHAEAVRAFSERRKPNFYKG